MQIEQYTWTIHPKPSKPRFFAIIMKTQVG
jgi:hypothetical protein